MANVRGVVGLRPTADSVSRVVCPPYDVIKSGSPLHSRLFDEPASMAHITLGSTPADALERLLRSNELIRDESPAFYVVEQTFGAETRVGVFTATEVSDYGARHIIRHEKTFDDKVRGRIALTEATGQVIGPVFLLTRGHLGEVLDRARARPVDLDFMPDFGGGTDLDGVQHRVWRIDESDPLGQAIIDAISPHPLYIADGHHRYHAALKGGLSHALAYVTEDATILAYDRVIKSERPFSDVVASLELEPIEQFDTPAKRTFHLYTRDGVFALRAATVPDDVVGRLDCAILERELYPHLGLTHDHISDPNHFDYYPESALAEMKAVVDAGHYDLAVALHPVSRDELLAVADAGLEDSSIVMPEKSTFFSPKVLTGLVTLAATVVTKASAG